MPPNTSWDHHKPDMKPEVGILNSKTSALSHSPCSGFTMFHPEIVEKVQQNLEAKQERQGDTGRRAKGKRVREEPRSYEECYKRAGNLWSALTSCLAHPKFSKLSPAVLSPVISVWLRHIFLLLCYARAAAICLFYSLW